MGKRRHEKQLPQRAIGVNKNQEEKPPFTKQALKEGTDHRHDESPNGFSAETLHEPTAKHG